MNTISEAEFIDNMRNGAITTININQNEAGAYQISIVLTWKEGDWHLVTTRKTVREWASLDRLVRHIRTHAARQPAIHLLLHPLNHGVTKK